MDCTAIVLRLEARMVRIEAKVDHLITLLAARPSRKKLVTLAKEPVASSAKR